MRTYITVTAALAATLSAPAGAQTIIADHWSLISSPGGAGTLRAGSPWEPGSTAATQLSMVDGVFRPEGTQWNNGSWWWDETQTGSPFRTEILLDASYTFRSLTMQADDNDNYLVEYWDGAAWQNAWTAPAVFTYGLITRTSGALNFTTDRFRLSAFGGDQYYAISEFQGFGAVPEPATWALMILGFGAVGGAMRRRIATRASVRLA